MVTDSPPRKQGEDEMSNPIHPDVRWGQTSTTPIDVDIAKTRRRIEEVLRKDTSDENIIKLAEELGIEVAHLPQQPEDYHNEPGRPNFGPGQVRHASDLKIGQMYFMMHLDGKKRLELRQKIQLIRLYCELATLHSKDVEEDVLLPFSGEESLIQKMQETTYNNGLKDLYMHKVQKSVLCNKIMLYQYYCPLSIHSRYSNKYLF